MGRNLLERDVPVLARRAVLATRLPMRPARRWPTANEPGRRPAGSVTDNDDRRQRAKPYWPGSLGGPVKTLSNIEQTRCIITNKHYTLHKK